MATSSGLEFPIGFDFETGTRKAEKDAEIVLKRLEKTIAAKPITIKAGFDPSAFDDFKSAFDSMNIKGIIKELENLEKAWKDMTNAEKYDSGTGNLTSAAQETVAQYNELTTALASYGKSLSKIAGEAKRAAEEEVKAAEKAADAELKRYNAWLAQTDKEVQKTQQAEDKKAQATRNAIAKQNAEMRASEIERYNAYMASAEKEAKAREDAEARKRAAINQAAHERRSAAAKEAQEAFKVAQALKAEEDVIANITAKLQIYNTRIQSMQVGSDMFNKTALEIRRLAEELDKANQRLADFQQKAFKGLGDVITTDNVTKLTAYREQLNDIEVQFNKLRQSGGVFNTDGTLSSAANSLLKQRQQIQKEMNDMVLTAADAQLQREKEITATIKQRQQEQARIKAQHKAELDAIKQKRAENDRIRKILAAQETTVAAITAKLQVQQQRLQHSDMGSAKFLRIAEEVKRLSTELEKAQAKVKELTGTAEVKNKQHEASVKKVSDEYRRQETYVDRLIRRMAVYASFGALMGFLKNVREVTAQFELQRVSLGAIIQDQTKANSLFADIKAFALKSPLKIMDLVTYTKQVAAYRIETDKLFDTTKRLADVSVGLGVDMQRLVLFYGQVKAAGYLRASEIRQATEAGIPLVELLAEKFTLLEGRTVSAEQVMDRVSKRLVSFGMVEEIFKDMTDAGGMFYNMQEKQSQTLYGMWAKLGDAASIMYNEIGNTAEINSAMKSMIQAISDLMNHWTALASIIQTSTIGFLTYKAAMNGLVPLYNLQSKQVYNDILAQKRHNAEIARKTSLYTKLRLEQVLAIARETEFAQAEWEEYIVRNKINSATGIRVARLAKEKRALAEALIAQKIYTREQLAQIQGMNKVQVLAANVQAKFVGLWYTLKKVGTALKTFWPIAVLTAGFELIADYNKASADREAAIKKVNDRYKETQLELDRIEAAYNTLKVATKAATQTEEEFAAANFKDKREQLQQILKILDKFGLKYQIDVSVLDKDNIDEVVDKWIAKLKEVNDLTKKIAMGIALANTEYQGEIMGWAIFGENLAEDMKDLSRSWSKLTVNKDFSDDLERMRVYVDNLKATDLDSYKMLSQKIGVDAKLAISQKRRNESEYQYTKRIIANYNEINRITTAFMHKTFEGGVTMNDFERDLNEVMNEIKKYVDIYSEEEPLTIRMSIDEVAAEQEWEDWKKEAVIEAINKERLRANLEIIPTVNTEAIGAVVEGIKAIITSEFPTLFTENDMRSLNSADEIIAAIAGKLDTAEKSLKAVKIMQNNVTYGSKEYETRLAKVNQLSDEILEIENKRKRVAELQALGGERSVEQNEEMYSLELELKDIGEGVVKTKQAHITALINANSEYDKQIKKAKELAEAEYDVANAAKERVTQLGLSSLAKDVQSAFPGLMVDKKESITNPDYISRYKISESDLQNVQDLVSLYDLWAQKKQALLADSKKIADAGISEATIAAEQARLDEKKLGLNSQLAETETAINDARFNGVALQYTSLQREMALAVTQDQRERIQENIDRLLGDTNNKEYAALLMKREGLKYALQENITAAAANGQIKNFLQYLKDANAELDDYGSRYNFHLPDNSRSGSGEDPWIILMKNRSAFMKDFQAGVENLNKTMQKNMALGQEQDIMTYRGASLGIDVKTLDGTRQELVDWYDEAIAEVKKRIYKMGGKLWEGLGVQAILAKDTKSRMIKKYQELLQELFNAQTDFRTNKLQKDMESKLKTLSEQIAQSKAAKDFYDKIFEQTHDYSLAANLTLSIYGGTGDDLQREIVEQIQTAFQLNDESVTIPIEQAIDPKTGKVNYSELLKIYNNYKDKLIEGNKDLAKTLVQNGIKAEADQIQAWYKKYEKAKSLEQQETDVIREEQAERQKILENGNLSIEEKSRLLSLSYDREQQQLQQLDAEIFKNSEDYIQAFGDLDKVSTKTLERVIEKLKALIEAKKGTEDVKGLKELVDMLNDAQDKLNQRNPFKAMGEAAKEYVAALKNSREAQRKLNEAEKEFAPTKLSLECRLSSTKKDIKSVQKQLSELDGEAADTEEKRVALNKELARLMQQQGELQQELTNKGKKVRDAQEEQATASSNVKVAMLKFQSATEASMQFMQGLASATKSVADTLGVAEDSELGMMISSWSESLESVNTILTATLAIVIAIESACWWMLVIAAVVSAITTTFSYSRKKRLKEYNDEIERQAELLKDLQRAYNNLEDAMSKAFGSDYLADLELQRKLLEQEVEAYRKQAEAEKAKGKDMDKSAYDSYIESMKDAQEELDALESKFSEFLTGNDIGTAATDFAEAWLDAYASFSNTTDAIKSKFKDMINNMVVNSIIAKIMEKYLEPIFEYIDSADTGFEYSESWWNGLLELMDKETTSMVNASDMAARYLEKYGISLRDSDTDLTGISRDIATASEESINGLAAGINTQNYYISYVPYIAEQTAKIVSLLGGNVNYDPTMPAISTEYLDLVKLQNEHLAYLPQIAANTQATVDRCERAAVACESMAGLLGKVIKQRGVQTTYVLTTN